MVDQTGVKIQWTDTIPEKAVSYEVLGGIFENTVDSQSRDSPPFEIPENAANHAEV